MTADRVVSARSRKMRVDLRFVVGIILVVVSIAGVWLVISGARQTTPIFMAVRTIMPGETIASADLRLVDVALGPVDSYLSPEALPADPVAMRTIEAGELVAREALGTAVESSTTTIVLTSSVGLPRAVAAGAPVELWAAPAREDGSFDDPRILVGDALVSAVIDDDAVIARQGTTLELVIPRSAVVDVLGALAQDSQLSVIPIASVGR